MLQEEVFMKKVKWAREQINGIRDRELRTFTICLYQAIIKLCKSKNNSIRDIARYASSVVSYSQDVLDCYEKILIENKRLDTIPNEHNTLECLLRHLFEGGHAHISRYHSAKLPLEYIMSRFERVVQESKESAYE